MDPLSTIIVTTTSDVPLPSVTGSSKVTSKQRSVILGSVVGGFALCLTLLICAFLLYRRWRRRSPRLPVPVSAASHARRQSRPGTNQTGFKQRGSESSTMYPNEKSGSETGSRISIGRNLPSGSHFLSLLAGEPLLRQDEGANRPIPMVVPSFLTTSNASPPAPRGLMSSVLKRNNPGASSTAPQPSAYQYGIVGASTPPTGEASPQRPRSRNELLRASSMSPEGFNVPLGPVSRSRRSSHIGGESSKRVSGMPGFLRRSSSSSNMQAEKTPRSRKISRDSSAYTSDGDLEEHVMHSAYLPNRSRTNSIEAGVHLKSTTSSNALPRASSPNHASPRKPRKLISRSKSLDLDRTLAQNTKKPAPRERTAPSAYTFDGKSAINKAPRPDDRSRRASSSSLPVQVISEMVRNPTSVRSPAPARSSGPSPTPSAPFTMSREAIASTPPSAHQAQARPIQHEARASARRRHSSVASQTLIDPELLQLVSDTLASERMINELDDPGRSSTSTTIEAGVGATSSLASHLADPVSERRLTLRNV